MKRLFIYLSVALFLTGCQKDLLDKKPLDEFDENTVWSDNSLSEGFVNSMYGDILRNLYYNQTTDDMTDNTCDNYYNSVAADDIDNTYDAGWNQYNRIRNCNLAMERIAASKGITEENKKTLVAEARFLRGMTYYYLAQLFGGVMIVDTVLSPNTPDLRLPRKSIGDTYDFILNDFTLAAADLPEKAATGKATKAAALAMVTRAGLQGAAYVAGKKNDYLQQVIAAAEKIIALGDYSMDQDYKGMFNDYDEGQGSQEIILGFYLLAQTNSFSSCLMQALCPNHGNPKLNPGYGPSFTESFEGWPDRFPSENLVEDYLVVDADNVAKKWNETSYYSDYQSHGGYASDVLYRHRDNRFYASFAYDSTMLFNNLIFTRAFGNMNALSNNSGWGSSPSNYYIRKNLYEAKKVWYSDPTNHHKPIIRLGEVYLNYAEALLQLGGRDNEAMAAINQTRVNHGGLPPLTSTTGLWDIYEKERRVDLVFENDWYWSLLRWAKFNNQTDVPELHDPIRSIDITADGKTFTTTNVVTLNSQNIRSFTQRRFLFPVPLSEIQANPNLLPNNDGW